VIIHSMRGLGDNIYQRAFVRAVGGPLWLDTPWPELYRDIPGVRFLRPSTGLRTQSKNIELQPGDFWQTPPRRARQIRVQYGAAGIVRGMQRSFGRDPRAFDLPDFGMSPVSGRYAVVRPVTVRSEWLAETRNPLPEYIAECAAQLRDDGITVVSVADLVDGHEWALDPLPAADVVLHHGQLRVSELLALVRGAELVVGGIGWLLPAAIAAGVPGWFICGGQGGYNAPELLTSPKFMDLSRVGFAVPDKFCRCREKRHTCDKRIENHAEKFSAWRAQHALLAA